MISLIMRIVITASNSYPPVAKAVKQMKHDHIVSDIVFARIYNIIKYATDSGGFCVGTEGVQQSYIQNYGELGIVSIRLVFKELREMGCIEVVETRKHYSIMTPYYRVTMHNCDYCRSYFGNDSTKRLDMS